jgi:phosphoribosylformylglycinamidine synthase
MSREAGTALLFIDLSSGNERLGGSILAQCFRSMGEAAPDVDNVEMLGRFFEVMQSGDVRDRLLAYHDRSDGGLFATVAEMALAGRTGARLDLSGVDILPWLFNEEAGAVIQVKNDDLLHVQTAFEGVGINCSLIGHPTQAQDFVIHLDGDEVYRQTRAALQQRWSETSYRIQRLRDNPAVADEEFEVIADDADPGLNVELTFDPAEDVAAPMIATGSRPSVAILREQGVNSQVEMAAVFHRAGFNAVDLHMSEILSGERGLGEYKGIVACGGFSYGDVLGAGEGWAKSILFHRSARDEFATFFERDDTFGLGVCNGCQMMAALKDLVPGAGLWPRFVRNRSEQFEARFSLVSILENNSVFLGDMAGSHMPIAVSHGEGRAELSDKDAQGLIDAGLVAVRFIENGGDVAARYPANPNGTPLGITGLTNQDGRFTIMMPHPERVYRTVQNSWHPAGWGDDSPWMRMFRNARVWVG